MYNNYGSLATKVYELTKPAGASINGDIDYYIERLEGITGKILEAGVGNGRMLIPLLEENLDVVGIDASSDMLAMCQQNLVTNQLKAELHTGNLIDFNLGYETFEGIIMPTSTFCLIETEELAIKVLTNFYNHLTSKGKLIFDLDLPFYPELNETSISTFEVSDKELITLEKKIVEIDWLKQQIVSHLTYSQWRNGELIKTELQPFLLRWYGLTEVTLLLEKAGFKTITISADYDYLETPTDSNQTITVEAHKE
ncbi:class I SAM-dependent methyltransferase [Vagococcus fluvialis]|uniref:Class I SAM-dependent methyltransferase n=1 Tax=Vagococcus fluvialis TaxID=2738 RepID=A0A7X6D6Q5_9ENTE|nr:class I SAM-dependent methyltransferase [Vagococcus fluvialis]NKC66871.1 class I SAM-dependent methyltransferase [Vagococcus fluvialis]